MIELPCNRLNPEELRKNMELADAGLARQRLGVGEKSSGGGPSSDDRGPLTGPKQGPATVGLPWEADISLESAEEEKGLVNCQGGLKYVCEYDKCSESWSTRVLPADQAVALVKMYEMHVMQHHGKKKASSEEEKYDVDRESYKEVIKERTIPASIDNRLDQLCPARFLPMPLQYQHIARNQPAQQTPVWERIDLAHLGLHMADTSIVRKIHNRNYAQTKLRDFLVLNLEVDVDDKDVMLRPQKNGSLRQTKNVRSILTVEDAVGALMNCSLIWRFVHPLDYGTEAIVRFLMNKIYHSNPQRRLKSVIAICAFFQSAMKGNADRVMGPENPRTYQELVSFYDSMDWSSGSPTEQQVNVVKSESTGFNGKRGGQGKDNSDSKKPKLSFHVCYAFNKREGCSRSQGDKCSKDGKQLMHVCSRMGKNGTVCGSKEHGQSDHI